jgi:translocation and assembly module TamA
VLGRNRLSSAVVFFVVATSFFHGFGLRAQEINGFEKICARVWMESGSPKDFSAMERRLVCGDSSTDEIGTAWAEIPPSQAAFFMRGFLQSRGFHDPSFERRDEDLFVRPGKQARLRKFKITGGPIQWEPPRRRLIAGEPFTPALLNGLESWALDQIRNEGYPCARAESLGDPRSEEAIIHLVTGNRMLIKRIDTMGDSGLRESALDRYNAFLIGGIYRQKLMSLTRARTQNDGFLQNLVLNARCEDDGVVIVRDVVLGEARTVRIGLGGSTDEGARFRALIRQSRIGSGASSAQTRVQASYLNNLVNRQSIDANFRWYFSPSLAHSYFEPSLLHERWSEQAFETTSTEGRFLYGWSHETETGRIQWRFGPALLRSEEIRGIGPGSLSTAYFDFEVQWLNHDFEYFSTSPQSGEFVDLKAQFMSEGQGAVFTAQRFEIRGQKLWNVYGYDPALLILAVRSSVTTLLSPEDSLETVIPTKFRIYLGGNADLRGFSFNSLPRSGLGGLAAATLGIEARLHKVIIKKIDAFWFIDTGMLGRDNLKIKPPLFMSPGVGARWESPIGVVRGFAAQRFALEEIPGEPPYGKEWRLGFTFGEEF